MKSTIFLISCLFAVSSARVLQLRHKRQLEVEGDNLNPSNDVVVIKDVNTNDNSPTYQLIPVDPNTGILFGAGGSDAGANPNTDIVDLDINEDDGTFRLGGRLPSFHDHFHQSNFADMFRAIQQRFDEMARRMAASFGGNMDDVHVHGPCCGHDGVEGPGAENETSGTGLSVASDLPENYNNTKTEIINIHGRQFLKKTTVIRKGGPGTSIFISSTTYEPINDSENTDHGTEDGGDLKPASSGSENVPSTSSTPSTTSSAPSQPEPENDGGYDGAVSSSSTTSTTESGIEREEVTSPTSAVPV